MEHCLNYGLVGLDQRSCETSILALHPVPKPFALMLRVALIKATACRQIEKARLQR